MCSAEQRRSEATCTDGSLEVNLLTRSQWPAGKYLLDRQLPLISTHVTVRAFTRKLAPYGHTDPVRRWEPMDIWPHVEAAAGDRPLKPPLLPHAIRMEGRAFEARSVVTAIRLRNVVRARAAWRSHE